MIRWHYEPDGEFVVAQSPHGLLRCRVFGDVGMLDLAVRNMTGVLLTRKARAEYGAKH